MLTMLHFDRLAEWSNDQLINWLAVSMVQSMSMKLVMVTMNRETEITTSSVLNDIDVCLFISFLLSKYASPT